MTDIGFLPATQRAQKIRTKELSSEELLRRYLDRANRLYSASLIHVGIV